MYDLVGHFLLFTVAIIAALAGPLILGRLIRPHNPNPEKNAIYECGEPSIGTAHIQFDLRFYVVALLFIVFDIEVAFFFPWATVFGVGAQLADERIPAVAATEDAALEPRQILSETLLSVPPGTLPAEEIISAETARLFAWTGLFDVLIFFAVLLVGFAYIWKRGDLDWVRAVSDRVKRRATIPRLVPPLTPDSPERSTLGAGAR